MGRLRNKILYAIIIALLLVIGLEYIYFDNKAVNEEEVVATIDGENIYQDELVAELKRLYGTETLNEMINRKVITGAAEKYGIEANQKEIDRQYNDFMKDYGTEEDFLAYLQEQLGWTKTEFLEYIEYYILWEEIATKDVTISDEEILAHYNANKSSYQDLEKFHIEQIIVETKEEADQVLRELNNGSDFNTLAKERSIDVFSLGNGGDLGIVTEEDYSVDPEIINKAKEMNIGEIASVELSNGGYGVIRLLDRIEATQYSYEDVKEEIRRELALSQVYSLPEVLEQLKIEMDVQILDPTLAEY